MSGRTSRVLAVSVPPEAADAFERMAEEEGRNKSELFREMLRVYGIWRETERFEYLQRSFAAKGRELGVASEEDVDRLLRQARRR
jgi:intergrase/recombinase